jgi:Kelch motif
LAAVNRSHLVRVALLGVGAISAASGVVLLVAGSGPQSHPHEIATVVTAGPDTRRKESSPSKPPSHEEPTLPPAKLASQSSAPAPIKKKKLDDMTVLIMVPDLPPQDATTPPPAGIWSDQGSPSPVVGSGNSNTFPGGEIALASVGGPSHPLTSPTGESSSGFPGSGSGSAVNVPVITSSGGSAKQPRPHGASPSHFGFVLLAGGQGGGKFALSSAQLYDPIKGVFVAASPMRDARTDHTATVLASGKILVSGGDDVLGHALSSAELYDPASGKFSLASNMSTARSEHSATLISGCNCPADGQVLIAGGVTDSRATTRSAELYDPATGKFTATGSMKATRAMHTATLIANGPLAGNVLIAGGTSDENGGDVASAELYDPSTGQFTLTGAMSMPREGHSATWLDPGVVQAALAGKVLIAGGADGHAPSNTAEVFNPQNGTFAPVGQMSTPRTLQASILLGNGEVLIAGGQSSDTDFLITAELFNPATAMFSATGRMINLHTGANATILENGGVLIAGGRSNQADLYNPSAGTFSATGKMVTDVAESIAALIR